ncbi:MAG: VWA domain-containing protein [Gemmatimonadota bacterium]|nr:VWA domain-containing protein [Gemmatimonadota bacterium]MDE2983517.1 VWA domain-containing protein [Gemmatimonadota bacterium]
MIPNELIHGTTAPQGGDGDLVVHLVRFAGELRGAGVPVTPGDEIDGTVALGHVDIGDREEVRLGLRASLKIERRAWGVFDAVFERCWRLGKPPERRRRPSGPRQAPRTWPGDRNPLESLARRLERERSAGVEQAAESGGGRPGYSPRAVLRRRSFELCTEEELAEMERLLSQAVRRIATRRSRRLVASARGRVIDIRRSFRRSLAQGGELVDLARRERAVERPHLVVLCDTSGSMDPYTRFLLTFVLSLGHVAPRTEVFAFNTSLTRLTPWITAGNVAATLRRFARNVEDWSGGTRIGECLREFADDYLRQVVAGDTSVLIFSDGLDRGDTGALEEALLLIRRRARRVIWLNPLMGDPRYRPEARGMRAALPHIDDLVPAHNLESLEALLPMLHRS